MSESPNNNERRGVPWGPALYLLSGFRVVAWVFALLLLYVLSMGPMAWLWSFGNRAGANAITDKAGDALNIVYAPLLWLMSSFETTERILKWYMSFLP